MISASVIKNLSNKLQTTELNIRREYVQHLFLSYFYQQKSAEKVYFKGGTALRIIFQSPRFSEDLDFSSNKTTINEIEDIVLETIREIEKEGIIINLKESKRTTGGYLAIIIFLLGNQEIAIQLEISQRDGKNSGEIKTIVSDFIPPYTLMSLSQSQLIAEKIEALLTRKKARDFYDLYYILRANLLPTSEKSILKKVISVLEKININFEPELKIFLTKSHWPIIKNFKEILTQEIDRHI